MTSAQPQTVYILGTLAEELIHNILWWCSPVDQIRAAATCKLLRKVYQTHNKHQTSHTATFSGSMDRNRPLCPPNVQRLKVLLGATDTEPIGMGILKELQASIDHSIQDGVEQFSTVQQLGLQYSASIAGTALPIARQCLQKLLQLLPNLNTLWIGNHEGSQLLLGSNNQHTLPWLSGACLELAPGIDELVRIPTVMPNLDTLCLSVGPKSMNFFDIGVPMEAEWLQPLSQLPHLQYLSLILKNAGTTVPDMSQFGFLRHLKITQTKQFFTSIDLCNISGLQQLQSLSLCGVLLDWPEAQVTMLNVSFLSLDGVEIEQSKDSNTEAEQLSGAFCWPKLKRVGLNGIVSEQVLQAMSLPQPAAAGLEVKQSFCMFDDFINDYNQITQPEPATGNVAGCTSRKPDIYYVADAPPILGPDYLAAVRVTSLQLAEHYTHETLQHLHDAGAPLQQLGLNSQYDEDMVFPTLQQLTLPFNVQRSIDSWYRLFSNCPLLADVISYTEDMTIMNNIKAAAEQLGITIVVQDCLRHVHYRLLRP